MGDNQTHQERLQKNAHLAGHVGHLPKKEVDGEEAEASCGAFCYLRGPDRAAAVEFRFRSGESWVFPYGWLGPWRFNPSEGILLKFSGDVVYLVLIKGSNLDRPLNDGAINLTSGGLQRHRVVLVREMDEDDIKSIGETAPTVDSIEVAEFESHAEIKEWLSKKAPAFLH